MWFDGTAKGILRVQIPVRAAIRDRFVDVQCVASNPSSSPSTAARTSVGSSTSASYPDANLVIDLFGTGSPGYYFCYRDESGSIVSTGGSSRVGLSLDQWSHVAVVCDREQGQVTIYVNGYGETSTTSRRILPATSAGRAADPGQQLAELLGMDGRGADLSPRADSRARSGPNSLACRIPSAAVVSPEALAAARRQELLDSFAQTHEAWAAGQFDAVRAVFARSWPRPTRRTSCAATLTLRIAQSHMAEGQRTWPAKNTAIADAAAIPTCIATKLASGPGTRPPGPRPARARSRRVAHGHPADHRVRRRDLRSTGRQ
jgi:hypothetical protein